MVSHILVRSMDEMPMCLGLMATGRSCGNYAIAKSVEWTDPLDMWPQKVSHLVPLCARHLGLVEDYYELVQEDLVQERAQLIANNMNRFKTLEWFTYGIASSTYVKIGKSVDVQRRLRQFNKPGRNGCIVPQDLDAKEQLVLLGHVEGDKEREFHDQFVHLWVAGEWFHRDREIEAVFT